MYPSHVFAAVDSLAAYKTNLVWTHQLIRKQIQSNVLRTLTGEGNHEQHSC